MRRDEPWVRARFAVCAGLPALLPLLLALSACGSSGPPQLRVSIATKGAASADVKAGDKPEYVIAVDNTGAGQASDVSVRLTLPANLRFIGTQAVAGVHGAARTQPSEPAVDAQEPAWGVWTLSGAARNADGTQALSGLTIDFSVAVDGDPGSYQLTPKATSQESDTEVVAPPLAFKIVAAPVLGMTISALQPALRPTESEHYRLTVTNDGSGVAQHLAITLTLPAVFLYASTDTVTGSASRSSPIDPVKGTTIPFWSGFNVPPRSDTGPGVLELTFTVTCAAQSPAGTYPVTALLTDDAGDVIQVGDTAAVLVVAPPTGTPKAAPPTGPSPLA